MNRQKVIKVTVTYNDIGIIVDTKAEAEHEPKTERWINTEDTGAKMYECTGCGCRAIARWYDLAVGTNGKKYCPYCGADMRGDNE